jgi:hypothetical protein
MQEENFEITKEELFEIVKRLGSEIVELRYELKITKQELKRLKRWVNSVSDFAIKKSIQK